VQLATHRGCFTCIRRLVFSPIIVQHVWRPESQSLPVFGSTPVGRLSHREFRLTVDIVKMMALTRFSTVICARGHSLVIFLLETILDTFFRFGSQLHTHSGSVSALSMLGRPRSTSRNLMTTLPSRNSRPCWSRSSRMNLCVQRASSSQQRVVFSRSARCSQFEILHHFL
jgi:hypothetical protein